MSAAVGGITALTSLTISSATNVSLQAVTTTGAVTQTAGSGTTTLNGAMATGSNVSITTGAITLSGAGSINANTGTNDVTLTAQTGAITSGTATTDITANNLYLSAITGIGSATTNPLTTRVSNLQATNSTSGDIRINNTGNLNVFGTGVQNTNGSVYINAASDITLTSPVTATYVELTASGSILDDNDATANDIITSGDARLESISGTLGTYTNPLEVSIGGQLYIGAGGAINSISAIFNGSTSDNLVHLLYNVPGLVIFNNHISGGNVLSQLNQANAQLNPYISNVLPSFIPIHPFIMDNSILEPKRKPFQLISDTK
jgi:hypothetical protein